MRIFVSYDRGDRVAVEKMVKRLRQADHYVWRDDLLRTGQLWWSAILDEIELADVVVFALSPESLMSGACTVERHNARQVRRPVLPVQVVPVDTATLPEDLAVLQIRGSVDELVAALRSQPASLPLPDPMPTRPPAPLSELARLRDELKNGPLDESVQFGIIAEFVLAHRSNGAAERETARVLMIDSARSKYLYQRPAQLLQSELQRAAGPTSVIVGTAMGSLGIFSFLAMLRVYEILPRPYEVVVPHLILTVVGAVLCAMALRRHRRSALLGLAICGLSLLAIFVDAVKNDAVPW